MSLIGFSPRGRGQSKSITPSPLPLSSGNIHVSTLAFQGTKVVLPPLTPLPPLPNGRCNSLDTSFSSTKMIATHPPHSTLNIHPPIAVSTSANPISSDSIHFEGKTLLTGSYSPSLLHIHQSNNILSNPSHQDITLFPSSSILNKGTILHSILLLWFSSFCTHLFRCC
jgi:hypothetical protein